MKSSSITSTKTTAGSGYKSTPSIVVVPAAGDMGVGASATATYSSSGVAFITMVNNGYGNSALPTIKTLGGGDPARAADSERLGGVRPTGRLRVPGAR